MFYSVEYSSGLFSGGVAYIEATSKDDAKAQVKRKRGVYFKLPTLKRICKAAYVKAQAR
jgi:hypothetical protein